MPLQIDSAELAGLAAEGVLYGIFLALFVVAGYAFTRRKARETTTVNLPMTVAAVLLIVLATARFSVDTANVFVAFISHDTRAQRIAYLEDVTQKLFTTKHSILICVLLVGDSFVNYRCWVVWGKNIYVVLLPIALSFTSAAAGSYTMWAYSHLPAQTVLSEAHWLTAFFTLSLVANALATSLLAFRIWYVDRRTSSVLGLRGPPRLMPIVKILLESGVINAAYLFAYTMTLVFGSEGLEIMSEIACPLTGIIFSIVIIRVGLHSKKDEYWTTKARTTTIGFSPRKKTTAHSTTFNTVEINISHTLERDGSESGLEMEGGVQKKNNQAEERF